MCLIIFLSYLYHTSYLQNETKWLKPFIYIFDFNVIRKFPGGVVKYTFIHSFIHTFNTFLLIKFNTTNYK